MMSTGRVRYHRQRGGGGIEPRCVAKQIFHHQSFAKHICRQDPENEGFVAKMLSKFLLVDALLSNRGSGRFA